MRPHIEFGPSGDLAGIQVAGLLDAIDEYIRAEVFAKFGTLSTGRSP